MISIIKSGVFRSLILSTWKLLTTPNVFKMINDINGMTYVEKKTMLINKYWRSFLISFGVIERNNKMPIVGITIGCKSTDMNLWNFKN